MHVGFGDCELDTERHTLRRRGQPVSLEPKALQVLVYLVQQQGRAAGRALQNFQLAEAFCTAGGRTSPRPEADQACQMAQPIDPGDQRSHYREDSG